MASGRDLRRISKCRNKPIVALLLQAIRSGHRYRMTRSGVMLYGPHGAAAAHFSTSDHRAAENFRTDLRKIGITMEDR